MNSHNIFKFSDCVSKFRVKLCCDIADDGVRQLFLHKAKAKPESREKSLYANSIR